MPHLTVQTPGVPLQELDVDSVSYVSTAPNVGVLTATKDSKVVGSWNLADIVGWDIKDSAMHG